MAALVVVSALAVGAATADQMTGRSHPTATQSPSSSDPSALDEAHASELASKLTSGRAADVESVLLLPPGRTLPPSASAQLHALAPVQVVAGSLTRTADDVAVVRVTTRGGRSYALSLLWRDDRWLIADSQEEP